MADFYLDENTPKLLADELIKLGHNVIRICKTQLRGKSDQEIFSFVQVKKGVIISADMGFGNILQYPLKDHSGIIIINYPNEVPAYIITREFMKGLKGIKDNDYKHNLIIMEPGRIRIRRGMK